jgi:hypothetical protein
MGSLSFYETAAGVIPLLIVASAIETHFLENLRPAWAQRRAPTKVALLSDVVALPIAVIITISGEFAALHVLLVQSATGVEQRLTALAVLIGAFGVVTPILNMVIKTTTTSLAAYGETSRRFALRFGQTTMTAVHLALYALAVLVLAGGID